MLKKNSLQRKNMGLLGFVIILTISSATIVAANPHPGQSKNVTIIGSPDVINGGSLPTNGSVGELGDFIFTNMNPSDISTANLTKFDTVVLNMASHEMGCNADTLSDNAKADLVTFTKNGGKLVIYDSECSPQNYSWLPFTFKTNNPGGAGATGILTIIEENLLSTSTKDDIHYIDNASLGSNTDAVGDTNVMTTFDPNWCLDMSGTNTNRVTGPVHTYAKLGSGLIIYNGLDVDNINYGYSPPDPNGLRKIWLQELQQPLNPSNLPCGQTVVGITLMPLNATNIVGQTHNITATLKDLLGNPQTGILVNFSVISGPNNGTNGINTTDANGQAGFTYTSNGDAGKDEIKACFTNPDNQQICSQVVTKDWITLPPPPVPELSTMTLMSVGILGLLGLIRLRRD